MNLHHGRHTINLGGVRVSVITDILSNGMDRAKVIILYKNPGSGNFVGKILPIMFTMVFGAMLVTVAMDTANTLNVKRKLDFGIQKCIDDCIEFNYSDAKAENMIKDKIAGDTCIPGVAEGIDVSIDGSGDEVTYNVSCLLKLKNGIMDRDFNYKFEEKAAKRAIN